MDKDQSIVKRSGRTCKICTSGHVEEVDRQLTLSVPKAQIARWLNEKVGDEIFTRQNVQTHEHRHLTLRMDVMKEILEEKDRQYNEDVKTLAGVKLHGNLILEHIVFKGMERILNGEEQVGIKDVLKGVEMLKRDDELMFEEYIARLTVNQAQFKIFADVVKEECSKDTFQRIIEKTKEMQETRQDWKELKENC